MRSLMMMGRFTGQIVQVADTHAAQGVADGWCRDTSAMGYPFDSTGMLANKMRSQMPESYLAWGAAGYPPADAVEPPPPAPLMILKLDNTNPAKVEVDITNTAKFANGMSVTITDTGTAADGQHVVQNLIVQANTFELAGVDLSAMPAAVYYTGMITPGAMPTGG